MLEGQPAGMQRDSAGERPAAAVLAVADDGREGVGELDANLVLAAGVQVDFQQAVLPSPSLSETVAQLGPLGIRRQRPVVTCILRCRSSLRR